MESPVSLRRVLAPPAVALSIAIAWSASALAFTPTSEPPVAQSPAPLAVTTSTGTDWTKPGAEAAGVGSRPIADELASSRSRAAAAEAAAEKARAKAEAAAKARAQAKAKAEAKAAAHAKAVARANAAHVAASHRSTVYRGRNHVWIPSFGLSRSISFWSCNRATPVGNYVYRWGCAGSNNVYLFGHAGSVFRALHDAYVGHRLSTGMRVVYADAAGRISTYTVRFWKVVSPTNAAWAFAAQSRPSMTLQTCVGAHSEYRLVVRLTRV